MIAFYIVSRFVQKCKRKEKKIEEKNVFSVKTCPVWTEKLPKTVKKR